MNDDEHDGRRYLTDYFGFTKHDLVLFERYHELIVKWQSVQNLVSRETLNTIWTRHFCDSARLLKCADMSGNYLDFGSGAGFPGLVIGAMKILHGSMGQVILVESNMRKVAFLRTVARELSLPVTVLAERIESVTERSDSLAVDFVTARAVADLDLLCAYSAPLSDHGARCLFHKGRDIDSEITAASNGWHFNLIKHEELKDPEGLPIGFSDGLIVEVSDIKKKA